MPTANSILRFTFTSLHVQICNNTNTTTRFQAFSLNPNGFLTISKAKSRRSINTGTTIYKSRDLSMIRCSINEQPGGPLDSSASSPGSWNGWILGLVLTVFLPFLKNKWGPLLEFKNKVEDVVQKVEDITEAVEKVADKVEDMADNIGDNLPAGKLKEAAEMVEKAADNVGKKAEIADELIDKLQAANEEMETFIKHVTDEASEISQEANKISKKANEVATEAKEIAKDAKDSNKKAS